MATMAKGICAEQVLNAEQELLRDSGDCIRVERLRTEHVERQTQDSRDGAGNSLFLLWALGMVMAEEETKSETRGERNITRHHPCRKMKKINEQNLKVVVNGELLDKRNEDG